MVWKYTLLLVGLLALTTIALAQSRRAMVEPEPPGSLIDIDTELGKEKEEEVPEESGSGKGTDDEDDDEDLEKSSGSGSGAYNTDKEEEKVATTTSKPLTPCQNLREASKHLLGNYVPICDERGDYGPMQCRGSKNTGKCWCVDRNGAEIPGTAVDGPKTLDCKTGENLSPCLFQFVTAVRSQLLGVFRPKCKINGDFEEVQCKGSSCYCVDTQGNRAGGRERPRHETHLLHCTAKPTKGTEPVIIPEHGITVKESRPRQPIPTKSTNPEYEIPSKNPNVNVNPPQPEEEGEDDDDDTKSPNETGDKDNTNEGPETQMASAPIMTQPGLLAAIIGGAVVGLLCAILLVMFIVYRMRKKDEGSYALDEPRKKSTYSPINQSDKEYYA